MNYGKIVFTQKTNKSGGRSQTNYKILPRVCYTVYFYKEEDEQKGNIAGLPYTQKKSFERKSEMNEFLQDNGYDKKMVEIIDAKGRVV